MYSFDNENDKLHFLLVVTAHFLNGEPLGKMELATYSSLTKSYSKELNSSAREAMEFSNVPFVMWTSYQIMEAKTISQEAFSRLDTLLKLFTEEDPEDVRH